MSNHNPRAFYVREEADRMYPAAIRGCISVVREFPSSAYPVGFDAESEEVAV